ncbi:MAG: hypothetical protein V3U80_11035 [Flavobacteriaceae bacterium]
MKLKSKFIKLTQWEHWATPFFYVPVLPYAFLQALKMRSLTFFLQVNPSIKNSGDGTESKYDTMCLIPEEFRPKSVLIKMNTHFKDVEHAIKSVNITYPLIAKPDKGFRGLLVKKIDTPTALKLYLKKNNSVAIILQEYVDYPNECGVFYHRLPNESKGVISSITLKKFLSVVGDGKATLKDLIRADKRAFLYFDLLQNIHQEKMNSIPVKDKKITLTVIGNHSKGTQFLNGNHLINGELRDTFDALNKKIDGWFYGRLDIKYHTFKELQEGQNFKILEINGILAEPTHIYDASAKEASYFKALLAIKNNWKVLTQIAKQNKENHQKPDKKALKYIKEMKGLRAYAKKIIKLNALN